MAHHAVSNLEQANIVLVCVNLDTAVYLFDKQVALKKLKTLTAALHSLCGTKVVSDWYQFARSLRVTGAILIATYMTMM